jgi:hypothetical protein
MNSYIVKWVQITFLYVAIATNGVYTIKSGGSIEQVCPVEIIDTLQKSFDNQGKAMLFAAQIKQEEAATRYNRYSGKIQLLEAPLMRDPFTTPYSKKAFGMR